MVAAGQTHTDEDPDVYKAKDLASVKTSQSKRRDNDSEGPKVTEVANQTCRFVTFSHTNVT